MPARYLTEADVEHLLDMPSCMDAVQEAFAFLAGGAAQNIPRQRLLQPSGTFHLMAAVLPQHQVLGFKAYTVFAGKARFLVNLYSTVSGELLAIFEANRLGQMRTGAASGVATRVLARANAEVAGCFGSGWQAESQVEAVCHARPIRQVRVYSRHTERRQVFATKMAQKLNIEVVAVERPEEAVQGCDVVITITQSATPVFDGNWLAAGTHINAAGSNAAMRREIDEVTVGRSQVIVVDALDQARVECGDLIAPIQRGRLHWEGVHELKDLAAGLIRGRTADDSITLFESQGLAIEDVAAAYLVYTRAVEKGIGQMLPF